MVWLASKFRRRLLTEAELTYDRARAIAIAAETATKDAEELRQQQPPADTVNKIKSNNHGAGATAKATADMFCTRCGKRNHDQASCYFRDKFCLSCDKKGHTKRMCKTKVNKNTQQRSKGKVHKLEEQDSASENEFTGDLMYFVESAGNVNKVTIQPIVVNMLVNGVSIDLELDSGSPVSIMPKWQYEKYFQSNKIRGIGRQIINLYR